MYGKYGMARSDKGFHMSGAVAGGAGIVMEFMYFRVELASSLPLSLLQFFSS